MRRAAPAPDAGGDAGPADATAGQGGQCASAGSDRATAGAAAGPAARHRAGARRPPADPGRVGLRRRRPRRRDRRKGRFAVTAAPGRHRLQAIASRYQAADVTVDVPPAGMDRRGPADGGRSGLETVVAAKPATPPCASTAEAARTTPGTGGDPFRVDRIAARRVAGRLAVRALRDPRRESRQHRLLPGRHARAGAVPLRARPFDHSPVPDRQAVVLPGRLSGAPGRLRLGRGRRRHRRAAERR